MNERIDQSITRGIGELTPWLDFLFENLELAEATDEPNASWEVHQLKFLNNSTQQTIDTKSRQIAWSWTAAAMATAKSILIPRWTSIFVSVNQDEAKEKVRYAKRIIEALVAKARPRLLHDNELYIELENGSRLLSHPCRPVRGKKADIYFDEFAHYPKDREIYTSGLPATTRGGSLHIGSSPLGAGGMFWEIYEQKMQAYPRFGRREIPWWDVAALCRTEWRASLPLYFWNFRHDVAPRMTTEERVRRFGSQRLVDIFESMLLEDFQQEYECAWLGETTAWITWDEIKRNQIDAQAEQLWYRQVSAADVKIDAALDAIGHVAEAVQKGKVEGALAGGMDVGRAHDLSELVFVGKGTTNVLPYRLGISLSRVKFDDQKAIAARALNALPITQLLIDRNGIGMQLAEQLHSEFGDRAQGVDFTNPNKELWSVELKLKMQRGQLPIPLERNLSYQIHSLKKKVTAAKNAVFDAERNELGHADKYWALALAVWAARAQTSQKTLVIKYA